MLRDALSNETEIDIALAMLQYLVQKPKHSDIDRDKTDCVVTWLYRHPRQPGDWVVRGAFAQALVAMLSLTELPPMADEYGRLVREFSYFLDEVLEFRDF